MKYKDYSDTLWTRISTALDLALKEDSQPIAAFDADGTLWDLDLGENFFHYQIDNKLVSLPPDPWDFYETLKAKDAPTAYLWLAQICQGQKIELVREWARQAVASVKPIPVFEQQKRIIDLFLSKGVQIYVVTASIQWAVEAGAELVGLGPENVLGVKTEIDNGIISDRQSGLITYRQGKVDALLAATNGKKPFFCSGNTMGDFQLLQGSTQLSLAVSAAARDDKLFRTEAELQEKAAQNSWEYHRFI